MRWLVAVLCLLLLPRPGAAEWQVIEETERATGATTAIAEVRNEAGYRLAIYSNAGGAVYARFMLNDQLIRLHQSICPSYQIDERQPRNSSLNSPDCNLEPRTSRYHLGTIDGNEVISRPLYELMNGSRIDYRFRLQAGGYDRTSFSLAGSKRALITVLGRNLEVLPR